MCFVKKLLSLLCVAIVCLGFTTSICAAGADELRVATFRCNITPPLGQPLISCDAVHFVEQPLLAKGVVIQSGQDRYVLCALDWCELRNSSYDTMRKTVAAAAGTDASRVAIQTVHQHTAPLVDMRAQEILAQFGPTIEMQIDPAVFEAIQQRLADAVKQSLVRLEPFDQIGAGQAKVDRVASIRRVLNDKGQILTRYSSCTEAALIAMPEGPIDPYIKTITLARAGKPLVRLHYYATHPQTYYGDGRATSDLPGDVREKLEEKEKVFQIYFNGCGGDVTLGKYNHGTRKDRDALAVRLLAGMEAAIAATKLAPAAEIKWRTYPLLMPARSDRGYTMAECLAKAQNMKLTPLERLVNGASQASFLEHAQQPIGLSCMRIGEVRIVHLPGEPLIFYQHFAQKLKPETFVAIAGYGDCGPGYLCPEKAFAEGGYEPTAELVKPESEAVLKKAIAALLGDD
jgi:hypothetical protein